MECKFKYQKPSFEETIKGAVAFVLVSIIFLIAGVIELSF